MRYNTEELATYTFVKVKKTIPEIKRIDDDLFSEIDKVLRSFGEVSTAQKLRAKKIVIDKCLKEKQMKEAVKIANEIIGF